MNEQEKIEKIICEFITNTLFEQFIFMDLPNVKSMNDECKCILYYPDLKYGIPNRFNNVG